MLIVLLMIVLAVNGGLFTGAVLYSAYETSRHDQLLGIAEKMWRSQLL